MNDAVIVSAVIGAVQIISILAGGGLVAYRIGGAMNRLEQFAELHGGAINELKNEVSAIKAVMTDVALQKAAIDRLEKWYDELRRGEGFVVPFPRMNRGQSS